VARRLDIPGALGPLYRAMQLLKPIIMMLVLTILLLNTGDCVNLVFADAQAADCCLHADCPFAGGAQMDTCCKNPVSPAKYVQAAPQQSISQPSVTYLDFPEAFAGQVVEIASRFSGTVTKFHAPPDPLNALFAPLLI
jgi:hypothetical protein